MKTFLTLFLIPILALGQTKNATVNSATGALVSPPASQFYSANPPPSSSGTVTLTGSVTGTGSSTIATTIANVPWSTLSGTPTTLSGYGITNGQVALTLTTTGTAGVASLSGTGGLNIPQYTYTLPIATASVLGGIKPDGSTITITGTGVIALNSGFLAGSIGNVLYAQKGAQDFTSFFADSDYSINGSSGAFLQDNGDASNLTTASSEGQDLDFLFNGNASVYLDSIQFLSGAAIANQFNGTSGSLVMTDGAADGLTLNGGSDLGLILGNAYNPPSGLSGSFLMTDGDGSSLTVSGNPLSGLLDGTGIFHFEILSTSTLNTSYLSVNGSGVTTVYGALNVGLPTSDGSASGIAAFQSDGSLAQAVAGTDYALPSIVTTSAATSGTVAFTNPTGHPDETIYLSSASTISSITIPLPTITRAGQIFRMVSKSAVTTLVISGGSIVSGSAPIDFGAGGFVAFQAINTTGTFIVLY